MHAARANMFTHIHCQNAHTETDKLECSHANRFITFGGFLISCFLKRAEKLPQSSCKYLPTKRLCILISDREKEKEKGGRVGGKREEKYSVDGRSIEQNNFYKIFLRIFLMFLTCLQTVSLM